MKVCSARRKSARCRNELARVVLVAGDDRGATQWLGRSSCCCRPGTDWPAGTGGEIWGGHGASDKAGTILVLSIDEPGAAAAVDVCLVKVRWGVRVVEGERLTC